MLGEKLGEFRGKVTGQRVLPAVEGRPTLETSFEISGTILGINATMMGTYWSTVRPDGTLYGECPQQGVLLTQDGETATWSGTGAGRFTGQGAAVSFRGTVYFQTTSPKLARLNGMAVLHEWEVDAQGMPTPHFGNGNNGMAAGYVAGMRPGGGAAGSLLASPLRGRRASPLSLMTRAAAA